MNYHTTLLKKKLSIALVVYPGKKEPQLCSKLLIEYIKQNVDSHNLHLVTKSRIFVKGRLWVAWTKKVKHNEFTQYDFHASCS